MERLQDCFADLTDPRTRNATRYDLLETLTIALCTTLSGAESGVDLSRENAAGYVRGSVDNSRIPVLRPGRRVTPDSLTKKVEVPRWH